MALECCDQLAEEVLIDVCLRCMMKEYKIFLEDLCFSSFIDISLPSISAKVQVFEVS